MPMVKRRSCAGVFVMAALLGTVAAIAWRSPSVPSSIVFLEQQPARSTIGYRSSDGTQVKRNFYELTQGAADHLRDLIKDDRMSGRLTPIPPRPAIVLVREVVDSYVECDFAFERYGVRDQPSVVIVQLVERRPMLFSDRLKSWFGLA